jgi:transposase
MSESNSKSASMHYVGLDVHARRSSVCILGPNGKVVKRAEVFGPWAKLLGELESLVPGNGPFAACFEASCGYGYLHERLSALPRCARVAAAHPGQLRLIFRSKRKNDRVDAHKQATLLYLDQVPQVHVPRADVRAWRGLIELRRRLVGRRTAVKSQVRALLRGAGLGGGDDVPAGKAMWSKRGLTRVAALPLPDGDALRRDLLLEELRDADARVARVTAELDRRAAAHPGVALLRTAPGVGPRTAEAFIAYVDDVRRFSNLRQVGCYLGLVPCQDSSAGAERLGHITGDGPSTVRMLLCEAAWQAVRRSPTMRAYFERVCGGDPGRKKIALVAVAHKLAKILAAMLRSGEAWRETPPPQRQAKANPAA